MAVTNTDIHELKINKKGSDWICRFQTDFDDGRFHRVKLPVSEADMTLYEGLPERPNPDYDPGSSPVGDPTLPAVPPDPTALDSYKNQAETIAVAALKERDAEEGVSPDTEIAANKEATDKDRAVAYLRRAWRQDKAFDAYKLFDRFNNYRLAQGWNLNQVAAELAEAGMTAEEWEDIETAYQYLSAGQRPSQMADYETIQDVWEGR